MEDSPAPHGPLTPKATRALLESLGHHPRKRLGQNFLIDGNIVRKSLQLAEVAAGETVVEVGPGLGTLTAALLAAGADVWAVELDRTLAYHLRVHFADRANFHLCEGDAVDFPRGNLSEEQARNGFKVVANLPYAITTPWIDALIEGPLPQTLVLMMQKEAADRLTAQPGSKHFSAVAIFLQSAFTVRGRHTVARSCFYPVPGVDSVLLVLERQAAPFLFSPEAKRHIRAIFTQRRKQIGTLVRGNPAGESWLETVRDEAGIDPAMRPEAIPVKAWQAWRNTEAGG